MTDEDTLKTELLHYLQRGRDALIWKLDGLPEYDQRRPVVATGTNLLGLVKHVASVEAGYLGEVFGRPFPESFPWFDDDAEANADLWATRDESPEEMIALYKRVWAHSDATVAELPLDTIGVVPWWSQDKLTVSLHRILLHMIEETQRHAGHADIVREMIDGRVGHRSDMLNLPEGDAAWWSAYRAKLQATAEEFR
jgi:uncharacterized damage-inducible protein DinB